MSQDQELIGLQNRLAQNLFRQESLKSDIALKESELSLMEDEQQCIENDIQELLGVLDDDDEKEQAFNNAVTSMLKDINLNLDENEQGETIQ